MLDAQLDSLLDDARFLEELAKVEALPAEDTSEFPKPAPTMAERPGAPAVKDELPPAIRVRPNGPQFVLAPPPRRHRNRLGRPIRTIVRIRKAAKDSAEPLVDDTGPSTASEPVSADAAYEPRTDVPQTPVTAEAAESLSAFPAESESPTDETAVKEKRARSLHPALAAVGFVLMMSVGAGAAALVFHDRVAQIVALWESARR